MSTTTLSAALTGVALFLGFAMHLWLVGVLCALGGCGVACYGVWKGMQQEGQGQAAVSVVMIVASLAVAGLLLLVKILRWL